jgi:hypothetical protein
MKSLLVLVPAVLLLPCTVQAATYYVDCGVSGDGGTGTSPSTAWKTVGRVNGASLGPGDTVLFKKGCTWRETLWPPSSGVSGSPITFGAYGSGANPIISGADLITGWTLDSGRVYWASLGSGPGIVFINNTIGHRKTSKSALGSEFDWFWDSGAGRLYLDAPSDPDTRYTNPGVEYRVRNQCIGVGRSYLVFDGLTVEKAIYANFNDNNPGSYDVVRNCVMQYAGNGISLGGQTGALYTGWEIHDNVCRYNATMGISVIYRGTHIQIYRNQCYENDTAINDTGGGWTGGIKLYDDTGTMEDVDIYENVCSANGRGASGDTQGRGVGIWVDSVQPRTYPILIHHNNVYDNKGNGIFIEIGSHSRVWGNVVSNCGTNLNGADGFIPAGIAVDTRESYRSNDNLIYNNTVYGGRAGLKCASYSQQAGMSISNNAFKNNIVIGQSEHRLLAIFGGDNVRYGSSNVYEDNCFGQEASGFIEWGTASLSTYAAWEAAYGGSTHSVEADPKVVSAGTGDFELQSTSPCVDAGADLGGAYSTALMPGSSWPSGVRTGQQYSAGQRWEVGAYIYPATSSPTPTPTFAPTATPTPAATPTRTPTMTPTPSQPATLHRVRKHLRPSWSSTAMRAAGFRQVLWAAVRTIATELFSPREAGGAGVVFPVMPARASLTITVG